MTVTESASMSRKSTSIDNKLRPRVGQSKNAPRSCEKTDKKDEKITRI